MLKTREQAQEMWKIFEASDLKGYGTKYDPSVMIGFSPTGQNVVMENGVIGPRDGSEPFGSIVTSTTPITSQWTFNKRDNVSIPMRATSQFIQYYHPITKGWLTLEAGYTPDKLFGHDTQNTNADLTPYIFYCNGVDAMKRWGGQVATYASDDGVNQITIEGTASLASLGFTTTGTVIIQNVIITYTGISGQTFTGCSTLPSALPGAPVAQQPLTVSAAPIGNIIMCDNAQLYVAGVASHENVLYWSKGDDATNWSIPGTPISGSPGAQVLSEGGAGILGLAKDEKVIYILKKSLIKTLTRTAFGTIADQPVFAPLKSYDGKSQMSGVVTPRAVFSNGNGIFFLNNNKELMLLSRLEQIDYPQQIVVSDNIKPTFQAAVFDSACGIVFKQKAYLAAKQSVDSTANDVVFVYDIIMQRWEMPYIGWNVSDFNVYNNELHWGSSLIATSYHNINDKTDSGLGYTCTWRSWQENFGVSHLQKTADFLFIELNMNDATNLTVSWLLDENGYTTINSDVINGTNTNIKFLGDAYNPFGANPYGVERYGSNPDLSGLGKRRVIIPFKSNIEFYTLQIQFDSQNAGDDWEVIRWGVHLVEPKSSENKKIMI